MAWKARGDGKYYYESRRRAGTVRCEYVGRGPLAELLAELREVARTGRARLRAAALADFEAFQAETEALGFDTYFERGGDLVRAVMALAGYHRHDRGPWRRRRMTETSQTLPAVAEPSPQGSAAVGPAPAPTAYHEALTMESAEFCRRHELAVRGDPDALGWLSRAFQADPTGAMARIFGGGSLADRIEAQLIARVSGGDPVAREAFKAQAARMRRDLAGPEPSATERILAERAALAYLHATVYELEYQRDGHKMGPPETEAHQRRIVRANRQFHDSIKSLAMIRRLAIPAIMVNLADQQINVLNSSRDGGRKAAAAAGQLAGEEAMGRAREDGRMLYRCQRADGEAPP